ncbi:MAG TPA: L,D-transpeptidase family protein [Acidimicrobiia bacterium]|nr:L,D-transpeptidase family protein [Acidimicrobiia bacterium]
MRTAAGAAGITLLVVGVVAGTAAGWAYLYGGDDDTPVAAAATTSSSSSTTTTTEPPPTTTTTIPPPPPPPFAELPDLSGGALAQGSSGDVVRVYEQRLVDVKFDPGDVDGVYDRATAYAVEALQKLHGVPATGRIGAPERLLLSGFQWPSSHAEWPNVEPDRVEIDLDRQVLIVWRSNAIVLISTTSTGNGERFCGGNDGCQYAVTPAGKYEFTWHVDGWRTGSLGRLYNPWYFNGGIAVHGYTSVPTHPASHGCARIPMHTSEKFGGLVMTKMPVYVLGTPAPEGGYPPGRWPDPGPGTPPPTNPPPTPPPTTPPTAPPTTQPTAPPTTKPPVTTVPPTTTPPTTAPPTTVTTAP